MYCTIKFVFVVITSWSSLFYNDECQTRATRVRYEWNFDFDNDTSENIFSHPYERLQEKEKFHSQNYFLKMPCSHAKVGLKSASQKLNFVMVKAISKSYTLDCSCKCPCTFPHSYALAANALARSHVVTHCNAASFR